MPARCLPTTRALSAHPTTSSSLGRGHAACAHPEQRDQIAAGAARGCAVEKSWQQIAVDHGIYQDSRQRPTVSRQDATGAPWGLQPFADVTQARSLRGDGRWISAIAREPSPFKTTVGPPPGSDGRKHATPLLGLHAEATHADNASFRALQRRARPRIPGPALVPFAARRVGQLQAALEER